MDTSNNQLNLDEIFIEEFNKLFCSINNINNSNIDSLDINEINKKLLYTFFNKWKNIWQENFENMIDKNLHN